MDEPKRIFRVRIEGLTQDLDGFSSDSLELAFAKAERQAIEEGWSEWRLLEDGQVVAMGDELSGYLT